MQIALATFDELQDWEADDAPLTAALQSLGATVLNPDWKSPTTNWGDFDACLIRTTWDYHQHVERFCAWSQHQDHQRFFNPGGVVAWNVDKRYLKELQERGVSCIPTVWLEPGVALPWNAVDEAWERAFIKPVVGANASQTLRFTPLTEAFMAERHWQRMTGPGAMLQPYLASVESVGERSAIFVDGVFCHGVRKVPVSGDYRVQDDHGASDEPWQPTPSEKQWCSHVVAAAEDALASVLDGQRLLYARVDVLTGPDGELLLTELELVEPSLFFRHGPSTATALAEALLTRCR